MIDVPATSTGEMRRRFGEDSEAQGRRVHGSPFRGEEDE
jgi:hypothetical protein